MSKISQLTARITSILKPNPNKPEDKTENAFGIDERIPETSCTSKVCSDAQSALAKGLILAQKNDTGGIKVKQDGKFVKAKIVKTCSFGPEQDFKEIVQLKTHDGTALCTSVTKKALPDDTFGYFDISLPQMREKSFSEYISGKNGHGLETTNGFIYLCSLKSIQPKSGAGTALMKYVTQKSIDEGFEGRIFLKAINSYDIEDSPVPFYKKLGFEFVDPKKNQAYQKWLKSGRGDLPFGLESGVMYLPKKNVSKLLNY